MPLRDAVNHYVSSTEPNGVQLGDEWWNPDSNRYYKRVAYSGNSVIWTEIGQPSLIVGAANTWPLAQTFSTALATSLTVSGESSFGGSSTFNGTTMFNGTSTFNNTTVFNGTSTFNNAASFVSGLNSSGQLLTSSGSFANTWSRSSAQVADIAAQENYLYLANSGSGNLEIYDITNPANITVVNTYTISASTIAVKGKYVYAGAANGLRIYNISNHFNINQTGSINTGAFISALFVQGNVLYAIENSTKKFYMIDISDPYSPKITASYTTTSNPLSIFVQNDYAYILENSPSVLLEVYSVKNPYSISLSGSITISGTNPRQVYVQGKYAYVVLAGSSQLAIFDIKNPSTIVAGTPVSITGDPYALVIQQETAYVVTQTGNSIYSISLSNKPSLGTPVLLTNAAHPAAGPQKIISHEGTLYTCDPIANYVAAFAHKSAKIQHLVSSSVVSADIQIQNNLKVYNNVDISGGLSINKGFLSLYNSAISGTLSIRPQNNLATYTDEHKTLAVSLPRYSYNTTGFSLYAESSIPYSATTTIVSGNSTRDFEVSGKYLYYVRATTNDLVISSFEGFNNKRTIFTVLSTTVLPNSYVPLKMFLKGSLVFIFAILSSTVSLFIYDVSSPYAPVLLSTTTNVIFNSNYNKTAFVNPNSLIIFQYSAGIALYYYVIDVSNPYLPTVSSQYNTNLGSSIDGSPVQELQPGYIAIGHSSGSPGIYILNFTNPYAVTTASSIGFNDGNSATSMSYSNGYLVFTTFNGNPVGGSSGRLALYDVRLPTSILLLGQTTSLSYTGGVQLLGRGLLYTRASGSYSNYFFDLTNPSNANSFSEVESLSFTGTIYKARSQGRWAFINTSNIGFVLWDMAGAYADVLESLNFNTQTASVTESASINKLTVFNDLSVSGSSKFFSDVYIKGKTNIRGSTLLQGGNSPSLAGSVTTGNGPRSIFVKGRIAYIVNYTGSSLQCFDVSNPSAITQIGSNLAIDTNPTWIHVQGQYAYVTSQSASTLKIYNVSNPAAITLTGSITLTAGSVPFKVIVQGKYAYIINFGLATMQVVDVANPTTPVLVATIATDTLSSSQPRALEIQGIYAYVANGGSSTLRIFNILNPTSPVIVSTTTLPQAGQAMTILGSYAYVLDVSSNCAVYNISNPSSVSGSIGSISGSSLGNPYGIVAQGNALFITSYGAAASGTGLRVYDISTPSSPTFIGSATTLASGTYQVFLSGRYAYVLSYGSSGANGLQMYDIGGTYVQQFEAGSIETSNAQVRSNLTVLQNADISGSISASSGISVLGNSLFNDSISIGGSATVTGSLSGNKITQPNLPFVANDISRQFDGTRSVFLIKKDQESLASLVSASGSITSIVASSASSFVVTHSLGRIAEGSFITISGCSTSGYNTKWSVSSSSSTTCTVLTPNYSGVAGDPLGLQIGTVSGSGTISGFLYVTVDSKDVEVSINGNWLIPTVSEYRYPWTLEYDLPQGQYKVSGSNLVLYNVPASGDKALVKITGISQTKQFQRYPFSTATIALGE